MRRRTTILDVLREDRGEQEERRILSLREQGNSEPGDQRHPGERRGDAGPASKVASQASAASDATRGTREDDDVAATPRSRRRSRRYAEDSDSAAFEGRSEGSGGANDASRESSTRASRRRPSADEPASPSSRRRRRYGAEDDDAPLASPSDEAVPQQVLRRVATSSWGASAASTAPAAADETSFGSTARRTTLASGRRSSLRFAEWLQSRIEVPRGYVIVWTSLAAACLALVFWLGRWSVDGLGFTRSTADLTDKTSIARGQGEAEPRSTPSKMSPEYDIGRDGVTPVANEKAPQTAPRATSGATTGAFQLISYAPVEANRTLLLGLKAHLEAHGIDATALERISGDGKSKMWILAAMLPASAVGDAAATASFLATLRRLPSPDPKVVRFDFSELEANPIARRDLPSPAAR